MIFKMSSPKILLKKRNFDDFYRYGIKNLHTMTKGAGSGIGKATCITFAKENAKVIAVDINKKSVEQVKKILVDERSYQITEADVGHSGFEMDVSQPSSIAEVTGEILKTYQQPPSIIVNCAGITRDSFLLNMSEDSFDKVIEVNLKGTYLIMQNFSKLLMDHNMKGSIINIGSIIGKIGNKGQVNYSASKAGVELLTKSAAKELGRYGIRCNVVLPGFVKTPMIQTIPERITEMFTKQIALGRLGEPEEVAQVITFLASDKSSYVNGASIEVTGGGF